ncbi:Pex12 amino terminal region-domain-containing protein [Phaeosphaeriaceae sp. PMI808]|nr:Pex12 amino terminal region-domain-containing protein [Phaeosphaeriaceae sp. PMI808]
MPAADFAAAQQRIAARRAQRAAQRAHHESTQSSRQPSRLPFPFGGFTSAWDAVKGRQGTRPEFRVGQVDAELLDEELLELLRAQVGEGLKYFGTHITDNWTPEILLGLRIILFKLSIWDQNASYGAHLQGLRYTDARSTAPNRPPPKPWQKATYGIITIGGRYAWTKWQEYLLSSQEDYTRPESPQTKLLAALTERLNSAHDIASLASFLVFLVNGRYRTITDRLLRLRLAPISTSTNREVSFEYLNRQLVWHAFTEFLLFLLPLVGISRWRRILGRTWRRLRTAVLALLGRSTPSTPDDEDVKSGELAFLPERTCAICYRDQNPTSASEADVLAASAGGGGVVGSAATDITNPYESTDCGCIYCFVCLAQRIANEEGEGWPCLRCGALVKECKPWNGDVIEEQPRRAERPESRDAFGNNSKSVGFASFGGDGDGDGEEGLREIEPMAEGGDDDDEEEDAEERRLDKTRGLDLGDSLAFTESSEWARADEETSSGEGEQTEEDEQSEEYDEDEEEEGEELGGMEFDQ